LAETAAANGSRKRFADALRAPGRDHGGDGLRAGREKIEPELVRSEIARGRAIISREHSS